jgi:hypothetical protein
VYPVSKKPNGILNGMTGCDQIFDLTLFSGSFFGMAHTLMVISPAPPKSHPTSGQRTVS